MDFDAKKFLEENPKPWSVVAASYEDCGIGRKYNDGWDQVEVFEHEEVLAYIQHLEAENERLKPLVEVGELVNRLPELIENCKIEHYPNTESWLVSDGGGCLSPRRYHSKQILEALREAFGEE